jgi:hypothetical protein
MTINVPSLGEKSLIAIYNYVIYPLMRGWWLTKKMLCGFSRPILLSNEEEVVVRVNVSGENKTVRVQFVMSEDCILLALFNSKFHILMLVTNPDDDYHDLFRRERDYGSLEELQGIFKEDKGPHFARLKLALPIAIEKFK